MRVHADPGQFQKFVAFIIKCSLGSGQTPKPSSVTIFRTSILGLIPLCILQSKKKGTKTMPLGYYCYKWYHLFNRALFLSLDSTPGSQGHWNNTQSQYRLSNSAPRGTVSVPFFSECAWVQFNPTNLGLGLGLELTNSSSNFNSITVPIPFIDIGS